MHGLISRRKAYATGRINQITTFHRAALQAEPPSGLYRFFRTDKSVDSLRLSAVCNETRRDGANLRQYYLQPTNVERSTSSEEDLWPVLTLATVVQARVR